MESQSIITKQEFINGIPFRMSCRVYERSTYKMSIGADPDTIGNLTMNDRNLGVVKTVDEDGFTYCVSILENIHHGMVKFVNCIKIER